MQKNIRFRRSDAAARAIAAVLKSAIPRDDQDGGHEERGPRRCAVSEAPGGVSALVGRRIIRPQFAGRDDSRSSAASCQVSHSSGAMAAPDQ